jgi:hypothetical protein
MYGLNLEWRTLDKILYEVDNSVKFRISITFALKALLPTISGLHGYQLHSSLGLKSNFAFSSGSKNL